MSGGRVINTREADTDRLGLPGTLTHLFSGLQGDDMEATKKRRPHCSDIFRGHKKQTLGGSPRTSSVWSLALMATDARSLSLTPSDFARLCQFAGRGNWQSTRNSADSEDTLGFSPMTLTQFSDSLRLARPSLSIQQFLP